MRRATPLGNALGLGSARTGLQHWWAQRVTAALLVPLGLWFVYHAVVLAGGGYAAAIAWLASPWNAGLTLVFVAVMLHHAQLGLQVVIEDYIHHPAWQLGALLVVRLAALVLAAVAAVSIIRVVAGG